MGDSIKNLGTIKRRALQAKGSAHTKADDSRNHTSWEMVENKLGGKRNEVGSDTGEARKVSRGSDPFPGGNEDRCGRELPEQLWLLAGSSQGVYLARRGRHRRAPAQQTCPSLKPKSRIWIQIYKNSSGPCASCPSHLAVSLFTAGCKLMFNYQRNFFIKPEL